MVAVAMQIEHCTWNGKHLVFKRPIDFKLNENPFSGEAIIEQESLDIYVFAASYDEAVHQVEQEIGHIWDEYILKQTATDATSKNIALWVSELVESFESNQSAVINNASQ